ncbi:ubiquitin-like small modifier protein 1 [Fonticella tunisiensis]|uniref:Molybdopterin synthase sulfur carrier subunit n=1 Tax=Fonticella tunisiensis TaxID=1096341 RepID=A0A4R7K9W6_9CLOT|nr:ubiquitin-like small modifier protein 1 [Fonticella tunisiensis]TDT51057.1 molybdopterin synthase sulfur carrier subunit [Fonticella tunisiensis]
MKVKFFAYLRDYTKAKEIELEYCSTVDELLHRLCDRYGDEIRRKLFNGSELSNEIIILINGRHIAHLEGRNTILKEDDVISIFPVVAGG